MSLFQKLFAGVSTLALTLSAVVMPAANAASFTDADQIPTWAMGAVNKLADDGVLNGYEDGRFAPNDNVTRAQFAKIITQAADISVDEDSTSSFSDVSDEFWGVSYIEAAKEAGVISGNPDGTFEPNMPINRAAASKMIVKAFNLEIQKLEGAPHFADVASDAWYYDYVEAVYAWSVVGGYDNGNFGPNDSLTRAQAAAMIAGKSDESGNLVEGAASAMSPVLRSSDDEQTDVKSGNLEVQLSESSPSSTRFPGNVAGVRVAAFDFTAGEDDVLLQQLRLVRTGLGKDGIIEKVALFTENGRVSDSEEFDEDDDDTTIRFDKGLQVGANETETVYVVATIGDADTFGGGDFGLSLVSVDDITTSAESVEGNFPIATAQMEVGHSDGATLIIKEDNVSADVSLGTEQANIFAFQLENAETNEDISFEQITLKQEGAADTATAFENFTLSIEGDEVASEGMVNGDYVTFKLDNPYTISADREIDLTVSADIIGDAGDDVYFNLDSALDIQAVGMQYGYGAAIKGKTSSQEYTAFNTANASGIKIIAGDLTVISIDAPNDAVRADKDDVVFGTIKVVSNAGGLELDKTTLNIVDTNSNVSNDIKEALSEVTLYHLGNNQSEDLTASSTGSDLDYSSSDVGIDIEEGENLIEIRVDTKNIDNMDEFDFDLKITNIGANSPNNNFKVIETADDKVAEITPSQITFAGVEGVKSTAELSVIPMSKSKDSVIGASDLSVLEFEIEAGEASSISMDSVEFAATGVDITSDIISSAALYQKGDDAPLDVVSGNDINEDDDSFEFDNFMSTIEVNGSRRYVVQINLVDDETNTGTTLQFGTRAIDLEDDEGDGIESIKVAGTDVAIAGNNYTTSDATTLINKSTSARVVTIVGNGSMSVRAFTSESPFDYDIINLLGGTTSDYIAGFELSANNESIKITEMDVVATGSEASTFSQSVEEVVLYQVTDADSDEEQISEVARKLVTSNSLNFNSLSDNLIVDESGDTRLYVKLVTYAQGQSYPGDEVTDGFKVTLDIVKTQGLASGDDTIDNVTPVGQVTVDNAPTVRVLPVLINNTGLVYSDREGSTFKDGAETEVANLQLIAQNTNNESATGESLDTEVEQLKFKIKTFSNISSTGLTADKFVLEDENGDLMTGSYLTGSVTTGSGFAQEGSYVVFNLKDNTTANEREVSVSGQKYDVFVTADIVSNTADAYFELSMDSGTGAVLFGHDNGLDDDSNGNGTEGYELYLDQIVEFGELKFAAN